MVESADQSGEDSDDRMIVAMGVMNTIESILTVVEESREILAQVEPIILQIIAFVLTQQCMGMSVCTVICNVILFVWLTGLRYIFCILC